MPDESGKLIAFTAFFPVVAERVEVPSATEGRQLAIAGSFEASTSLAPSFSGTMPEEGKVPSMAEPTVTRGELDARFDALRNEFGRDLAKEVGALRTDVARESGSIRTEIEAAKGDVKKDIEATRGDVKALGREVRIYMAVLAGLVVVLSGGIGKSIVNKLQTPEKTSTAVSLPR